MVGTTTDSLPQQDEVTSSPVKPLEKERIETSLPSKAAADLYGYGDASPTCGSPYSLNRLMSNRSSLKNLHTAFVRDIEKRRGMKSVGFTTTAPIDYAYGEGAPDAEPPTKRRRCQRRNSKTPAMLMRMNSPLVNLDFLTELEKDTKETKKTVLKTGEEDSWDDGLQAAEDLVKQLRSCRRNSDSSKC